MFPFESVVIFSPYVFRAENEQTIIKKNTFFIRRCLPKDARNQVTFVWALLPNTFTQIYAFPLIAIA